MINTTFFDWHSIDTDVIIFGVLFRLVPCAAYPHRHLHSGPAAVRPQAVPRCVPALRHPGREAGGPAAGRIQETLPDCSASHIRKF